MSEILEDGLLTGEDGVVRCWWACSAAEYRAYHDTEWGFPVSDDVRLFEKLSLEGFQAGLSWLTILRKREAFRAAFAGFEAGVKTRLAGEEHLAMLADGVVDELGPGSAANRHAIDAQIRRADELQLDHAQLPLHVAQQLG